MKSKTNRFKMAEEINIDNGEEKRDEKFSKELDATNDTLSMIKELLDETTSKAIKELGFERNEKVAGVYGDGTTYGTGVEENEYNIIITGRPRKYDSSKNKDHGPNSGTVVKQVFIGAKRMESEVNFEIKGKTLHLQYKTTEAGFFRGVDDKGKTYMVNERLIIPLSKAKKALKDLFTNVAQREVGFLTNTKLGVEDRLDASTTSIVETLDMENLTLKNLFKDDLDFGDNTINEGKYEKLPDDELNIPAQQKLNKVPVKDGKFLLFDDEEVNFEEIIHELGLQENDEFKERLKKDYGVEGGDVSKLTVAEKKDFFNSLKNETIEEITTAGPAGAGAGRYDTKFFAKAFGRKFAGKSEKKSKGGKKSDVGAPYNIPVNDPIYQEADGLNESKKSRKSLKDTPYGKKSKRPTIDKDYNVVPESKSNNASKPYTQVVKIDPNYHPLGMPFVKPNSKEELERTSGGPGAGRDFDKLKRMGIEESESDKKQRLIKRKFSSSIENNNKGINKRYIVTEKTSSEYEKDRWKKLSLFKKFETIKESEELNEVFENIEDYDNFYLTKEEKPLNESVNIEESSEKTIEVEKEGSVFGITQKFYEKDFLNENKSYILDLNSMVFVKNPNSK